MSRRQRTKHAPSPKSKPSRQDTHLAEEPCNHVAKHNSLVCLVVVGRRGDTGNVPEVGLPLIEPSGMSADTATRTFTNGRFYVPVVAAASVEKEHAGGTLNEPATVEVLDAAVLHVLEGLSHGRSGLAVDGSATLLFLDRDRPSHGDCFGWRCTHGSSASTSTGADL